MRLRFLNIVSEPKTVDIEMGVPTTASATTITTAAAKTALLLLRLLLETRRFPTFAFKVTNPQPCLPCPPPLLCPFLNTSVRSSIPCPLFPDFPHCRLYTHVQHTSLSLPNFFLASSHTLCVDSKRKASTTPRTPKLLSPPVSSSCARYSSPSEA